MNKPQLITILLTATLATGVARADADCNDPVADWQSRETLRQMFEAEGWKIHRIKVDEGCYEVKGFDQNGNKIKAEYFPATLRLRKLETTFKQDAVLPDGLPKPNKYTNQDAHNHQNNGDRP